MKEKKKKITHLSYQSISLKLRGRSDPLLILRSAMTVGKKKKAREEEKYVMLKGDDEIGYGEGVVCKPGGGEEDDDDDDATAYDEDELRPESSEEED